MDEPTRADQPGRKIDSGPVERPFEPAPSPEEAPPRQPPSDSPGSSLRRLWWLWVLLGIVAVFLIAFLIGRSTQQETVAVPTTSTTQATGKPFPAPTIAITEKLNGATVEVGIGWVVLLQLTGNPDDGSAWNVHALNASLVQVLPGPKISYTSYAPTSQALYTYSALTVGEGEVQVQAENVSASGQVNGDFSCTIRIVSAAALPTTTTVATPSTNASSTATTSASTTTEAPTTTAAPNTTGAPTPTGAPTTTTAAGTTTTKASSTTTSPSTTTTKPPTTTTKPPSTPTTTSPVPPIEVPAGYVLLGPLANGHIEVVPTTAKGVKLALPDDTAGDKQWQLGLFDEAVLKLRGAPTFVPLEPGSTKGARVWTFNVVGRGSTDLEAQYEDPSGTVSKFFFVSVSVEELVVTPY